MDREKSGSGGCNAVPTQSIGTRYQELSRFNCLNRYGIGEEVGVGGVIQFQRRALEQTIEHETF